MHYSTHHLRHLRAVIGRNIRAARDRRRWTLARMAQEIRLPADLLDRFETGRNDITLPQMVRIACVLGLRMEQLFIGAE